MKVFVIATVLIALMLAACVSTGEHANESEGDRVRRIRDAM